MRVRGGDTFIIQAFRAFPDIIDRRGEREAAAAEIEATQCVVARVVALSAAGQQLFFQHVFADDAEIDHAIHYQARNIVIAHAQDVDRHILRQRYQTLGVQINFYAAAGQQFARIIT